MMGLKTKFGASPFWGSVITGGILACLGGVFYALSMTRGDLAAVDNGRAMANELRRVSQQLAVSARETEQGSSEGFRRLQSHLQTFDGLTGQLREAGFDRETDALREQWAPLRSAAETLLEAAPSIVFTQGVYTELETSIGTIQSELAAVVDTLREQRVSADTVAAAQKTQWLIERSARNIEKILSGDESGRSAADDLRSATTSVVQIMDALQNGSRMPGVERLRDAGALASIQIASDRFAVVADSADRIASAASELGAAAAARQSLLEGSPRLADTVADLGPVIERQNVEQQYDRGPLTFLFGAPALLAVGLLVVMYRQQRRRVLYTEQGVSEINGALLKIAEGDLTVHVPESNTVTQEIAREINASTRRQRELIRNIRTPFVVSVEEINKIGKTARGQVTKGKELTRSVGESTTAATEMVRTSEEIKSATVSAARTSEHNREQVARGYELTKDMSKASADVRESVQQTSKSAKRQSELIQSVTTAAEYIQALNTKISVVAINTRIEAEKAGEYGRPFLGIAEAIADLLREAEEEGRKIISEVRMLQDMSAENLSSMENTVGTVVTILEYIERLHTSLEDINAGSDAITSIITSVDDAAGQSADSAQHMNATMARIRERNQEISQFSEFTQVGVSALQKSMREVAENLSQFKIGEQAADAGYGTVAAEPEALEPITGATRVYGEREMSDMEYSVEDESTLPG